MADSKFDAIVVGSGISGGWAAKELTEKGLNVLMLDRGHPIRHGVDYTGEHKEPWEVPFRGLGDRALYEKDYPVNAKERAFTENNRHFFLKDSEAPYQTDEDGPFHWVRGGGVGGRSLLWGRQVYRWSDLDFEANAKDGHGVDWPIRYKDIEPWYDHVEKFIGVSGEKLGLDHLPDGQFQPPMKLNCVEDHVRTALREKYPDRHLTIGRVAVLTEAIGDRAACHYCGPCHYGCSTGSYFSTQSSTLPAALKTGRLEVKSNSLAEKIEYDPKTKRATGVSVVHTVTGERTTFHARVIFLCASTLGTTHVLLNSRADAHPNGLANSSGVLGKYLMDHTFGVSVGGLMPIMMDKVERGFRPNGFYIPRFRNVKSKHEGFVRGYGYQGAARRIGWQRALQFPGFGAKFKADLRKPGPWFIYLGGFGECLPYEGNRARLHPTEVDRFGIPQLDVHFEFGENERAMARDEVEQAKAMVAAAGGVPLMSNEEIAVGGKAIHEMGTARMGRDPGTSVLNAHNQAHDVPNLFVTDGACMTSSACQNPSITYMALTARAADFAVGEMKKGAI